MALAREGASIVACDILDQVGSVKYPLSTRADLDETAHRVEAAGGRFIGVKADVRDPQAASGVIGLAKSLALEVAAHGITVSCVCPTSVNTPLI